MNIFCCLSIFLGFDTYRTDKRQICVDARHIIEIHHIGKPLTKYYTTNIRSKLNQFWPEFVIQIANLNSDQLTLP